MNAIASASMKRPAPLAAFLAAIGLALPAAPLRAKGGAGDLVNLAELPDPPLLDIRYATKFNFTGEKLYPAPAAFLHKDAADALAKAQAMLREKNLSLRVLDAWRPLSVQQKMWDLVRDERYVSDPAKNRGRHTRGTAVDVTFADLMGNPLPMPSGFDDFSEKAHRDFEGAGEEAKANSRLLEEVMKACGFEPYPTEWWHFDLKGRENYPPLDVDIPDQLKGGE